MKNITCTEIKKDFQPVVRPFSVDVKCRVLLVDDCPDTVRLIQAYMADPGIALTVENSARKGIETFKTALAPFNVVLMDMEMPVMDGCAAAVEIRRWEVENRLPRTPIAALTALSDIGSSRRILAAGCALHLTKPVSRQTLLQVIHQYATPSMPAPELLPDFLVTCNSELMDLDEALATRDVEAISRIGRRLVVSGKSCGLAAICEIGMSLEHAPNLDAALYGTEKLRCCLSVLDGSKSRIGPRPLSAGSAESVETQVIRDLLPEFVDSTLEKIRMMVLALERGDYVQIKTIANQLKGTGAAFGMPTVSKAGSAIRSASDEADDRAIARELSGVIKQVTSLQPSLG